MELLKILIGAVFMVSLWNVVMHYIAKSEIIQYMHPLNSYFELKKLHRRTRISVVALILSIIFYFVIF